MFTLGDVILFETPGLFVSTGVLSALYVVTEVNDVTDQVKLTLLDNDPNAFIYHASTWLPAINIATNSNYQGIIGNVYKTNPALGTNYYVGRILEHTRPLSDYSDEGMHQLGTPPCKHVWKNYIGLNQRFIYCTLCDEKKL